MADPPPSLSGDPKDMAKQYEEYTVKVSEHHAFVQVRPRSCLPPEHSR